MFNFRKNYVSKDTSKLDTLKKEKQETEMKKQILVVGKTLERANIALDYILKQKNIEMFNKTISADFISVKTETQVFLAMPYTKHLSRCHQLFIDKEIDKQIVEERIIPLMNLSQWSNPFYFNVYVHMEATF